MTYSTLQPETFLHSWCVFIILYWRCFRFNIYDNYCVIFSMCHFPSFQYLDIFCNNYVFVCSEISQLIFLCTLHVISYLYIFSAQKSQFYIHISYDYKLSKSNFVHVYIKWPTIVCHRFYSIVMTFNLSVHNCASLTKDTERNNYSRL